MKIYTICKSVYQFVFPMDLPDYQRVPKYTVVVVVYVYVYSRTSVENFNKVTTWSSVQFSLAFQLTNHDLSLWDEDKTYVYNFVCAFAYFFAGMNG